MRRLPALVLAASLAVLTACGGGSGSTSAKSSPTPGKPSPTIYKSPPATLPVEPVDLSTAPPPWIPPALINQGKDSAAYVAAAGLPYGEEMLSVHYHAHLDLIVDGKPVAVPPYIGFVTTGHKALGLAPLHTHQGDGVIHIENSVPATFVLGQFLIEWGVRLTPQCIGGLCAGNGKELAVFVNGKRAGGDPARIVLTKHEEIAIEFGDAGKLPPAPSSYAFASGE
jgi:hypothetical protein